MGGPSGRSGRRGWGQAQAGPVGAGQLGEAALWGLLPSRGIREVGPAKGRVGEQTGPLGALRLKVKMDRRVHEAGLLQPRGRNGRPHPSGWTALVTPRWRGDRGACREQPAEQVSTWEAREDSDLSGAGGGRGGRTGNEPCSGGRLGSGKGKEGLGGRTGRDVGSPPPLGACEGRGPEMSWVLGVCGGRWRCKCPWGPGGGHAQGPQG